jgi:hypothetical protein
MKPYTLYREAFASLSLNVCAARRALYREAMPLYRSMCPLHTRGCLRAKGLSRLGPLREQPVPRHRQAQLQPLAAARAASRG